MQNDLDFQTPFVSNRVRTQVLVVFLSIILIVDLIGIISDLAQVDLVDRVMHGASVSFAEAQDNDDRQMTIGFIQFGLFIVTAIAFLFWIHRAHKNLPVLGARDLKFSSGQAVAGFFIPFLNFVRPHQVVTEIWKASDPSVEEGTGWQFITAPFLITFWWLAYLASGFIGNLVYSRDKLLFH